MGKVIATVGVIVGAVALAATGIGAIAAPALAGAVSIGGVSASTLLLAGTALQAVGSALTKRPKLSTSSTERLNASLVTDTPRKIAFGRTALNTDLRYQEWWGKDQEYCSQVFVLASHHCEAVEEIWLDDKLAWSAASGVTAAFTGYFVVMTQPKAGPGSVFRTGWSNRWGANATFNGCATLYLQFKVTGNGKKGQSPFSSSITSRVTVVGKGALLPDPRFDSTAGGSGAVRMADQTTWGWSTAGYESGRNPALALLFYLLGWRIQDPATGTWKLAVGRGVPVDRIDLGSFITAANMCDEIVQRANGGSEPRYRCDGTFSEGDDPSQVIASLETCMNAKLRDSAGRFALQVLHNDLATPIVDFTDDDVLGDFTWTAGNDLNDRRNVVRGRYTNPGSLYQLVDFPQVRLAPVDGIERIDSIDLALVQSPSQAQRLAKQRLQRQQYQGTFAAEFNARAWAVKDGDVVRLTFAALGFNRKLFRVAEGLIDTTGVVPLALVEEHADIYAWDRSEAPAVEAAEPNQFNPLLAPIIVAIDDAGKTAEWPAITGEGKPDDDATNSADPNSPFGPGGTVGGTVQKLNDFDTAIAAARKYQDTLDTETIPAINKAVSDAGERITATRKAADDGLAAADKKLSDAASRLDGEDAAIRRQVDAVQTEAKGLNSATDARVTREVAVLADADSALGRRIDSLVAEGGYDDRDVRAQIKRVDEAAVSRDEAIGRTITEVRSTLTSSFAIVSWGLSTPLAGRREAGIYNAAGVRLEGSNRGWNVATWNADNQIIRLMTFDTIDGLYDGGAAQMAAYLDSLAVGTTITVHTYDEPFTNHMLPALIAAMQRCGAGEGFTSPDWAYRGAYALIGQAGVGRGGGDELYRGTLNGGDPAIDAYIDKPFALLKGKPQRIGAGTVVDSQIRQVATTAVDARQAVGNLSTSVDTRFGGVNDTLGRYGSSITALSDADKGFAQRADGLEASARSFDTALNGAGGVQARLTSYGATLADFPNRYAAVSRAEKLEAQLNGDDGSRLLSRAENTATALVDNLNGAVNGRMDIMVSEYNGIGAALTQQAGVVAGIDGRTAVYWSVTGTTPDGSTMVRLSKADGSPGQFYIGANLFVDGNAIFNGTVTIRALDRSTMTATTSSSVSGTYGGAGQGAYVYIPNLGADMAIRSGGSIYITFAGNLAGQTDASGNPYPSVEILNAADNSVLASLRLPTVGFGNAGRLDNYVIRILNVWGDLTIRWRVANRATDRNWSIVSNPSLSVYWTAL